MPHLGKNFRGAFVKHKIYLPETVVLENDLPSNVASIDHVIALVEYQENKSLKLAPFLKKADCQPNHFLKMDVGSALHVFHNDVANGLRFLVTKKNYPKEFLTTAWFIETVRHWFDLMTSRCKIFALSRSNMDAYEKAVLFLKKFMDLMKEIKIGEKGTWLPVQTGCVMSTKSVLEIHSELLLSDDDYLLTSRLSQDKLENLFGLIRKRSLTPTALEFRNALKVVTLAQFFCEIPGSNYQADDSEYILDFFAHQPQVKRECEAEELDQAFISHLTELNQELSIEEDILYYLSGYTIHGVLKYSRIACDTCLSALTSDTPQVDTNGVDTLIKLKDYTGSSLIYCALPVFREIFVAAESMFVNLEKDNDFVVKKNVIPELISAVMQKSNIDLPTCHAIKEKLVKRFVTFRMKISAKELTRTKRDSLKQKKLGSEKGSRSMAAKKVIADIK